MENNENKSIQELMMHQPICNIGVIGHVANGKSTLVRQLTGTITQRYANEIAMNKTIKLGYANAKIFKCPICPRPTCYKSGSSEVTSMECETCESSMKLVNHISMVDCPGHNLLTATMMNGTCVMDYTILVESLGNKDIPAPQTKEHLKATTLTGTKNKIVCLNKLDLVKKDTATRRIEEFKKYLETTIAKDSLVVPVAATHGINIDVLCEYLAQIKPPERNINSPCQMIVIRSFNVNKPGTKIKDLHGGVIGGSIIDGTIRTDEEIILKPGYIQKNTDYKSTDKEGKRFIYTPLRSKIISIRSENTKLTRAIPGGLIGIELDIDPSMAADDGLVGNIMVTADSNDKYDVYEEILIDFEPFEESLKLEKDMKVVVNINACNSNCTVAAVKKNKIALNMDSRPICVKIGDYITISTNARQDTSITILGRGKIEKGFASICK
jgi:translation initiation factor 2 subunit 3